MGHKIALCAALSGFKEKRTNTNLDILNKAIQFADTYLKERVSKEKLTSATKQAHENIAFVTTWHCPNFL
jgi:3-hydroxybutyryl-CoA dehydrogenase